MTATADLSRFTPGTVVHVDVDGTVTAVGTVEQLRRHWSGGPEAFDAWFAVQVAAAADDAVLQAALAERQRIGALTAIATEHDAALLHVAIDSGLTAEAFALESLRRAREREAATAAERERIRSGESRPGVVPGGGGGGGDDPPPKRSWWKR